MLTRDKNLPVIEHGRRRAGGVIDLRSKEAGERYVLYELQSRRTCKPGFRGVTITTSDHSGSELSTCTLKRPHRTRRDSM